jgi:trans-aconitate methyltransferase
VKSTFFDALYATSEDPWAYRTRWYEQRKRNLTLSALPRQRYTCGFEAGCSIGLLSAGLAGRCARLICYDESALAVATARRTMNSFSNVSIQHARIPDAWPSSPIDLIVLSEVLYYLDIFEFARVLQRLMLGVTGGCTVVACDWLRRVPEATLSVRYIHAAVGGIRGLHRIVRHEESDFLLDIWSTDSRSPAQHEGIA